MSNYKKLTSNKKFQIEAQKKIGLKQDAIAQVISVSQSTISRELNLKPAYVDMAIRRCRQRQKSDDG